MLIEGRALTVVLIGGIETQNTDELGNMVEPEIDLGGEMTEKKRKKNIGLGRMRTFIGIIHPRRGLKLCPQSLPTDTHRSQGMTQKEKKESKCSRAHMGSLRLICFDRISPTISIPEPVPEKRPAATERHTQGSRHEEKVQDMELEIPSSPPPVEDILAVRRARRQAILAKYADASGTADASGISSAAEPPTKFASSDPLSQKHMVDVVGQLSTSEPPDQQQQQQQDEESTR